MFPLTRFYPNIRVLPEIQSRGRDRSNLRLLAHMQIESRERGNPAQLVAFLFLSKYTPKTRPCLKVIHQFTCDINSNKQPLESCQLVACRCWDGCLDDLLIQPWVLKLLANVIIWFFFSSEVYFYVHVFLNCLLYSVGSHSCFVIYLVTNQWQSTIVYSGNFLFFER